MLAFARMPKAPGGKPPKSKTHAPDPVAVAADLLSPEHQEVLDLARFGKRFGGTVVKMIGWFGGSICACAVYLIVQVHGIDTRLATLQRGFDDHIKNHNGTWSHGKKVGPVELIRSPGRIDKHYATLDFFSQASNDVGVS